MTARLIREPAAEALATKARLIEIDRELEVLLQSHPDAALIRSLPGMGAVLAAELIAGAGDLSRFRSADALAAAAGIAPVLRQSGKMRFLRRPAGGNKGLKRIFYQSAFCSPVRLTAAPSMTASDGEESDTIRPFLPSRDAA